MITIKSITLSSLATAIMAVLIPLNLSLVGPVPITLTVFVLSLLTLILTPQELMFAVVTYWALVAIGLPIAVGYKGGLGSFVNIWSGYLWGYIWYPIMSFTNQKLKLNQFLILVISLILLYISGLLGLVIFGRIIVGQALKIGVLPFWILDLVKITIAYFIYKKILFRLAK